MSETAERTLLVKTQHQGLLRVTIPADAKVTFAGVNPQSRFNGHCLRVYRGSKEGPQLAVFTDVLWFRDVDAIKVQRQVKTVRALDRELHDGKGHAEHHGERDVHARWEDDDATVLDDTPF